MLGALALVVLSQWADGPYSMHTRENRRLGEEQRSFGRVCQLSNLITFSEGWSTLTGNWSFNLNDAANAGQMIANAGVSPIGVTNADRLVCDGGAGTCRTYQQYTLGAGRVETVALWVKGVNGPGIVYMYDTSNGLVVCNYTTEWTQCVRRNTTNTNTPYMMIGCESNTYGMPVACPAMDVYLWGAQINAGWNLCAYAGTNL